MIIENNNKKLIYILCVFVVELLGTSIYGLFIKKCEECPMCSAVSIKEVEVPPTYQVANYQGTAFKMPLDWNFVDQKDKYAITNKEENIFINIETLQVSFEEFVSSQYQKTYMENLQTSNNIKINKSSDIKEEDKNYYLMEGTYNSYDYMIVAVSKNDETVLVKVQFYDNVSYDKLKDVVLKFALSPLNKHE
jgi:diphthamide synthase (EF-2-diphthine--ammonia ligase)